MPRGDFDRSARRAQTRALLLQAAASVYARCGFNGATLDEVAAEAGFTKGAVYDHFGSKENLLLALMEEHLAGQVAEPKPGFGCGHGGPVPVRGVSHQSGPRGTPSAGLHAAWYVGRLTPLPSVRTLPSASPVCIPPVCGVFARVNVHGSVPPFGGGAIWWA